jgi:Family of unknown function (DUF6364)
METKLTLRLDEGLIENAKREARNRGTSLSQMVADYFRAIQSREGSGKGLPPVTASLLGSLKGRDLNRAQYRRHLGEKYR